MLVARRALTGTLTALAIAVAGPALSAHGSGYRFQTLTRISGGSVQACRMPSAATKPYVIKLRVNARNATTRLNGSAWASRNNVQVGKKWTSGWINPGQVSSPGTVLVPRASTYRLSAGLSASQMGNGGNHKAGLIQAC